MDATARSQSLMAPSSPEVLRQIVATSPLRAGYEVSVDRESAYELLMSRLEMGAARAQAEKEAAAAERARVAAEAKAAKDAERAVTDAEKARAEAAADEAKARAKAAAQADKERAAAEAERARAEQELAEEIRRTRTAPPDPSLAEKIFKDATKYKTMDGMARSVRRNLAVEIARGVFGIGRR